MLLLVALRAAAAATVARAARPIEPPICWPIRKCQNSRPVASSAVPMLQISSSMLRCGPGSQPRHAGPVRPFPHLPEAAD
jgi:hypothetical protein